MHSQKSEVWVCDDVRVCFVSSIKKKYNAIINIGKIP